METKIDRGFFNTQQAYMKMIHESVDVHSIRTKEEIIDSGKFQRDSRGLTDDADSFSAEDMILFLENALPYDDMEYLEFSTNGSNVVVGGFVDLEPAGKIQHDIAKIIDGTEWEFEWEDEGCFSIRKTDSKHVNPYLHESTGSNRFFNICEAYQSMLGRSDSVAGGARRYRMVGESSEQSRVTHPRAKDVSESHDAEETQMGGEHENQENSPAYQVVLLATSNGDASHVYDGDNLDEAISAVNDILKKYGESRDDAYFDILSFSDWFGKGETKEYRVYVSKDEGRMMENAVSESYDVDAYENVYIGRTTEAAVSGVSESLDPEYSDKDENQYGEKWSRIKDTYLGGVLEGIMKDIQIDPTEEGPKMERISLSDLHICEDGHLVAEIFGGANGGGFRGVESNWPFYMSLVKKFLSKLMEYDNKEFFKDAWLIDWDNDCCDDCWTLHLGIKLSDREKLKLTDYPDRFPVVDPEKLDCETDESVLEKRLHRMAVLESAYVSTEEDDVDDDGSDEDPNKDANELNDRILRVKKFLGWNPVGGVSIVTGDFRPKYGGSDYVPFRPMTLAQFIDSATLWCTAEAHDVIKAETIVVGGVAYLATGDTFRNLLSDDYIMDDYPEYYMHDVVLSFSNYDGRLTLVELLHDSEYGHTPFVFKDRRGRDYIASKIVSSYPFLRDYLDNSDARVVEFSLPPSMAMEIQGAADKHSVRQPTLKNLEDEERNYYGTFDSETGQYDSKYNIDVRNAYRDRFGERNDAQAH